MKTAELTIGRLAKAAAVNIETIRYYQRLALLPTPAPRHGAFRTYPAALVDRVRFIKRSQELGFSLAEIAHLLKLEDGANRNVVRRIAGDRLRDIQAKLSDLQRMARTLEHLIGQCESAGQLQPCPIIQALAGARAAGDRARPHCAATDGRDDAANASTDTAAKAGTATHRPRDSSARARNKPRQ